MTKQEVKAFLAFQIGHLKQTTGDIPTLKDLEEQGLDFSCMELLDVDNGVATVMYDEGTPEGGYAVINYIDMANNDIIESIEGV